MGREGHAILLDCRHLTSDVVRINPDLPIVICNTRAERNLVGSDYDERRARCEEGSRLFQRYYPGIRALRDVTPLMFSRKRQALPEPITSRCQFIIEENKLALDLTRVLPEGRPKLVHSMFEASYRGARDLYEIISPAMDVMMNVMSTAPGAVASRQAGAGIGDRMVALVNDGFLEPFTKHVINTYQQETEIQRKVYVVQTAPGAMILDWV